MGTRPDTGRRERAVVPAIDCRFLPAYLRLQESPPSPLPRAVLALLVALLASMGLWATFGRLDIIAPAEGKLVPRAYLKIVQPAEAGVVRDILVEEGRAVRAGEVLLRLDPSLANADTRALTAELALRTLQLRRIDAELGNAPLRREANDPDDAYAQAEAQYLANRRAYHDALRQEQAAVTRTRHDLDAGPR